MGYKQQKSVLPYLFIKVIHKLMQLESQIVCFQISMQLFYPNWFIQQYLLMEIWITYNKIVDCCCYIS